MSRSPRSAVLSVRSTPSLKLPLSRRRVYRPRVTYESWGVSLLPVPLQPENTDRLSDLLNLWGDLLAELHNRLDPDERTRLTRSKVPIARPGWFRSSSTLLTGFIRSGFLRSTLSVDVSRDVYVLLPVPRTLGIDDE
jgi:hypothetical protein